MRDTKRIISALTDAKGEYAITFKPLPGEAGRYYVGADHPGVDSTEVQDEFTLLGMRAEPIDTIKVVEKESVSGSFIVKNLSDIPLSGISVGVIKSPSNLTVSTSLEENSVLPGLGEISIGYTIEAVSAGGKSEEVVLQVNSSGGVSTGVTLPVEVIPYKSELAVDQEELRAGMLRGWQTLVEFKVENKGGVGTGPIDILLPNEPWIRLVSQSPIASLQPGESSTVTLQLLPSEDMALGEYTGALALNATNSSLMIPFSFRALSEAKGDLKVTTVDEYTYYAEGSPKLAGATVVIKDAVDNAYVAEGVTDTTGILLIQGIAEGYYNLEITADKHTTYRGVQLIKAGGENEVEAFLSRQTVEYIWKVEPTEVEDRTKITIETIFETFVPIPVVTIEPALIDLAELTADVTQIDLTITNHGLIAANDFTLYFSDHPWYKFEPLIKDIGVLSAKSSLTIPLIIRRLNHEQSNVSQQMSVSQANANKSSVPCAIWAGGIWKLMCGPYPNSYGVPIHIIFEIDCSGGGGGGGGGGYFYSEPSYITPTPFTCSCDPNNFESQDLVGVDLLYLVKPAEDGVNNVLSLTAGMLLGYAPKFEIDATGGARTCCKQDGSIGIESFGKVGGSGGIRVGHGLDIKQSVELGFLSAEASMRTGEQVTPEVYTEGEISSNCGQGTKVTATGGFRIKYFSGVKGTVEVEAGVGPVTVPILEKSKLYGTETILWNYKFFSKEAIYNKQLIEQRIAKHVSALVHSLKNNSNQTKKLSEKEDETFSYSYFSTGVSYSAFFEYLDEEWSLTDDPDTEETETIAYLVEPYETHPENNDGNKFVSWTHDEAEENGIFTESLSTLVAKAGGSSSSSSISSNKVVNESSGIKTSSGGGVCARVRLRIDQDLIMTRSAFNASLELINNDDGDLASIEIAIGITDEEGNSVMDLFGIDDPRLSGITAVDGTGVISSNSSGKASWSIYANSDAAPEEPVVYQVSGFLRFKQEDTSVVVPLEPVPITVFPDARLQVDYFHQRDVFSDDPFTDEIEPSIPFTLGVMVKNTGKGEAKDVQITSAQPEIIENEKGLLIDFKIIATEVAGQNLEPTLTANFGGIDPGKIKLGRWLLTSTLQGLFIDYKATFEHIDSLGDARLSLVESVNIHEMIHQVEAIGAFHDGLPDFLVNDFSDREDMPDTLYLSDGSTGEVSVITESSFDNAPRKEDLEVVLTASMPQGWAYLRVPDPADGAFLLSKAIRSDGVEIPFDVNVWTTDRTFIGRGRRPVKENILHLLDYNSAGAYTLYYKEKLKGDTDGPQSMVNALPKESQSHFGVSWSGQDDKGIHSFDIFVSTNNGGYVPWLSGTTLPGSVYEGVFGNTYAFYSIARDYAGNTEKPPSEPDAVTTVALKNEMPVIGAIEDVNVREGDTVRFVASGTDTDGERDGLRFSIDEGAPGGAVIDAITGEFSWITGETHGGSSYPITVRITDSGFPKQSDTESFAVTVEEVNVAPELHPVHTLSVARGETATVLVNASDGDLPKQALTYVLGDGAPEGMVIDSVTGALTWYVPVDQNLQSYLFNIRVTDNGVPAMSDSKEMLVIVVAGDVSPDIDCPDSITISCFDSIDPEINANLGKATATDGCEGDPVITYHDAVEGKMDCSTPVVLERTWTATNACGGSSSCVQTILIEKADKHALHLSQGMNMVSFPVGTGTMTCKGLLPSLGTAEEIENISRFNSNTRTFEACDFTGEVDFPIVNGEGYIVRMLKGKEVHIAGKYECADIMLVDGFNLIAHPNPAENLTAYRFLEALGAEKVSSLQRFNPVTGAFETAALYSLKDTGEQKPIGVDFPIKPGEGYILYSKVNGLIALPGCED